MRAIILTTFLLTTVSASAQDSVYQDDYRASVYRTDLYRSDIYRFADATIHTYARPLHWKQKQWLTLGGILAGTAAITLLDKPVRHLFLITAHEFPDIIEDVGYHYGKPYSAIAFTGGFYLVGMLLKDRWAKDTGLNLGVTLLTSGLLQTLLKDLVGRARPGTEVGPYKFKIPAKGDIGYHSFPSGHGAVAIGITLVLSKRIESRPIKIVLYALAATTALSRLHTDQHWFSDIAFGYALAWFCNETASRRLSTNRLRKQSPRVSWTVSPRPQGLALVGRF